MTERKEIRGGWLVRILHLAYDGTVHGVGGITFVPDPHHEWEP